MLTSLRKQPLRYILLIVFLVLSVQTAAISRPFVGHYASYQTSMASISRNMLRENFSELTLPKTDVVIGGKRSLHLNQYPFSSLLAALGARVFGGTLEFWGRFQAVIFNLLSAVFLALLVNRLLDRKIAWMSIVIFLLSPYTLIYGQCFMSESLSLFLLLFSLYWLLRISSEKSSFFPLLISGLSFSVAVTGRIHFILFYPLYSLYLWFISGGKRLWKIFLFSCLAFALPLAWCIHTYLVSIQSENVHTNLFLQITTQNEGGRNPLTTLEYYRRVFDTMSQMMLTPLLFPFFVAGPLFMRKSTLGFWLIVAGAFLGSAVALAAPLKVWKHDFYLYGAFPFIATIAACGLEPLIDAAPRLKTGRSILLFTMLYFVISSRFFLHPIFHYPKESRDAVRLGQAIQRMTGPDDRVIVFGKDSGSVFYYTNRAGWAMDPELIGKRLPAYQRKLGFRKVNPMGLEELQDAMKNPVTWFEYLRREGASYFCAPSKKDLEGYPALLNHLGQHFSAVSLPEDNFYLFKLKSGESQ